MTSASREMDSGAALRASAISASRSAIRYCSRGAMLGYFAFASWAVACHAVANMIPRTIPLAANEEIFLLGMVFLPELQRGIVAEARSWREIGIVLIDTVAGRPISAGLLDRLFLQNPLDLKQSRWTCGEMMTLSGDLNVQATLANNFPKCA